MCILLFNMFGYLLLTDCMQQKSDVQLEARLDSNQYDEAQLIELKIPLHLPYQTARTSYERYYGEIRKDGIAYTYVKRKLCGDTLYLKCIPNTRKMQLEAAKNDFLKNTSDLGWNGSKKQGNQKSEGIKKLSGEYEQLPFLFQAGLPALPEPDFALKGAEKVFSSTHMSPEQPPDLSLV